MVTGNSHCEQPENNNRDSDDNNLQDYPNRFHFSKGLAAPLDVLIGLIAEPRSGRLDGRARSPVLNASAVALVKIAACVSWLTLRADVRFRCALTISG